MPFYEYQCNNCGHTLEAMQKVSDPPLKKCPHCGKPQLQKLMSAPVFRLKGGGWYETDFKSDQDNKRNLADRPEDAPKEDKKESTATEPRRRPPPTPRRAEKPADKPAEKAASPESGKKSAARASRAGPLRISPASEGRQAATAAGAQARRAKPARGR